MKSKSIFVALSVLMVLAGCNSGGSTTTNNGVSITLTNQANCKTITAPNGTCTVDVSYYAQANSSSIGQYLGISLPDYYLSNITSQCNSGNGQISTTIKNCTITITSQTGAQVSQPQTAKIYPANLASSFTSFIIGGGN